MTVGLVSEARPIPWKQLSTPEQREIQKANEWIAAVASDAKRERPVADDIDTRRSGRVLFIDGVRGAGKTSLMLTLLAGWSGEEKYQKYQEPVQPIPSLRVLLPVLDFDPIPRGMPLHGWLLEPWRKEAERLEAKGPSGGSSKDLSERWADIFERAVIGWTPATVGGTGVVEKAIAYQEQASGWIETHTVWHDLVNTAVCRSSNCLKDPCKGSKDPCKEKHSFLFVVAIDDVDLQVEQIPQLLHAIRLLHHPNVVYVLTGHYEHLKFALELDYIDRHGHRAHTRRHGEQWVEDELWEKTKGWSEKLRDAFLEKALPKHARLSLPILSTQAVLDLTIVGGSLVRDKLGKEWTDILKDAGDLPIATARQAQHAIERHIAGAKGNGEDDRLEFIADLCRTTVEKKDDKPQFTLRGRLTTRLGSVFQVWEGDRLKIMLTDRPSFAFIPDFEEEDIQFAESANRALVVQLAVESKRADALALAWSPEAGVVATEVRWESKLADVRGIAVFHWPWLERPTGSEVLQFGQLTKTMSGEARVNSRTHLKENMIVVWLSKSLEWRYSRGDVKKPDGDPPNSLKDIADRLEHLCDQGDAIKIETVRWVSELIVMTAPYFGLPDNLAEEMRKQLNRPKIRPDQDQIVNEEIQVVENAIIAGQAYFARIERKSLGERHEPSAKDFDDAVKEFLTEREKRSPKNEWWSWRKRQQAEGPVGING
jgi:hypothetical protein